MKTLLALLLLTVPSHAAVIYSGLQDISLPYNGGGIYVNLLTAATSGSEPGTIETAPWLFMSFGGSGIGTAPLVRTVVTGSVIAGEEQTENLATGSIVGLSSRLSIGDTGYNGSETHIGPSLGQFVLGTQGYLGFQFEQMVGGPSYFGFMRVTLDSNGVSAKIHDWSYEDVSGMAISVPEPSRLLLLLMGAVGLIMRRHRLRRFA